VANTVEIHVRSVDHTRGFADTRASIRGLGGDARNTQGPLDTLTGKLAVLGGAAHGLAAIFKPALFTAATPALLGLAAATVEASGALLILPGVAATAGLAIGTLAIATSGFSDALASADTPAQLKKVEEALAKLSPSAREAALAIRGLKAPFDELKQSLQENLFRGLGKEIDATARSLMTSLKPAMDRIATSTNATLKGIMRDLRGVQNETVQGIGINAARAWQNLLLAVRPIQQALLDIMDVGAKVFADITTGVSGAASAFAIWIRQLKESGRLEEVIRGGLAAFKQLWEIAKNVWSTLSGLFQAAGADGEGFLATLERLTQAMSDWVNSAKGQETIAATFSAISGAVGLVSTAFQTLGPIIEGLAPIIDRLIGLLTTELPGGLSVAEVLIYGWAIKVAAHWALVAAGAVTATITTTLEVAKQVVQWAVLSAAALANAARIAAAWLIAMGPIGLAVAALAAAAILIIANWDKIKGHAEAFGQWFASDFPNFIRGGIDAVIEWLTVTLPDGVRRGIDAVVNFFTTTLPDGVRRGIDTAIEWVKGLPGRLWEAVKDAGSWLWETGKNIVTGLWEGIKSMGAWLADQLWQWIKSVIPDPIERALGISSPSKVALAIGKNFGLALGEGITRTAGAVAAAARGLAETAASSTRDGMDLYRTRKAAHDKHRADWARRNPGKEDTNTTVGQFYPEYAAAVRKGFRGTVQQFYSQYHRGGGGSGGGSVPSLIQPRGAYADNTRGASFGGNAATIHSATHSVNRGIPARYDPATGGSSSPPVVIGRQTMLGQLISEILRRECRINGGNVQLWLGAG
jgi:hypothetical protein